MTRRRGERLVVHVAPVDAVADAALMAGLRAHGVVVGRLAPRLALVEVGRGRDVAFDRRTADDLVTADEPPTVDEAGLSGVPGVLGVYASDPPPGLRETLTEVERLFVDGWLARSDADEPPDGDGVVWDADPDRLPPDPPVLPPRPRPVP